MCEACCSALTRATPALQVLPTQLIPDEKEGKVLRVRFIQKEGKKLFDPVYLFDEGSTISWIPCGRKLTCSFPGIKFYYGPDTYYGEEVRSRRSAMSLSHTVLLQECRIPLGSCLRANQHGSWHLTVTVVKQPE